MSEASDRYNCIAWAAAKDNQFWWPHPDAFWPTGAPFEVTLEAFAVAYATLGYMKCDNTELEPGFEKIVIYVNTAGAPTHAARQLPSGRWTSKLGRSEDIEHALPDALTGDRYGSLALTLRRPRQRGLLATIKRCIKELVALARRCLSFPLQSEKTMPSIHAQIPLPHLSEV